MKNLSAYLTVYVSLTLTVVTSFCLVLIEGVRQSTIRTEVECAMDVGLNSIFAEFNKELFNRYNLFYIDTSYGTSLPSYLKTQNHLDNYLRCNLSQPTYLQQFYILDFLKLDIESISISKVARATDNNGYNLRKNIMNAIKDDYGIVSIEMLADWYKSMEKEIDFESLNEDTLETRNENLELENWNDYNEISAI